MAAIRLSSQRITHVIHIADLHVRCGNSEAARIEEYEAVFHNFLADIAVLPAVKDATALCVIAGDVFETKTRAETAGAIMLFNFINQLQQLLPIVVICGNHDFKQSEPDTPDSVDMFTTPYKTSSEVRVNYLKETDRYVWGNIGFGLCSIKDTLRVHNTAGVVANLPDFPSPDGFPEDVEYRVALFHGTISQSALPSGRSADTVAHGYPLQWFAGYDAVMLGDNHQQQLHKTPDGMHWGYPGSLVQQNFGEPLFGHGYILWDIPNNTGSLHHIYNDFGAVTVALDLVVFSPTLKMDYRRAAETENFPRHPRVRVIGDHKDMERVISNFKSFGVEPMYFTLKGSHAYVANDAGTASASDGADNLGSQMSTLYDLNSPQYWESYMNDQNDPIAVSQLIHEPKRLALPLNLRLPVSLADALNLRNNKIHQLLQTYDNCVNSPTTGNHKIVLKYMEWDNLMTFGTDNRFDFENMDNKIALLNGANATGKSSFLDVLCIAIFGVPTASRRDFSGSEMTSKIVNDHKELNSHCGTLLVVTIDNNTYEIYRSFQEATQETIKPYIIVVYKYVDTPGENYQSKEVVAEGATMVTAWVNKYFGTADEMLMSTILCQSDTTNFFFKSHAEQRHILDKALHLDTISSYVDVLDESIKAHKYMVDKVASYRQGMLDSAKKEKPPSPEEIAELQRLVDVAQADARKLQVSKDELLASIGDMSVVKKLAREHDDEIYEFLKTNESQLQAITEPLDKAAIAELRNVHIRLQVEYENMVETAHTLEISEQDYVAKKKGLSKATKELAAHLDAKSAIAASRYTREHIRDRLQAHSDWLKTSPQYVAADVEEAQAMLVNSKKSLEEDVQFLHKLQGYNVPKPMPNTMNLEDLSSISAEEAMEKYKAVGFASPTTPLPHSSSHYANIITAYKAWETTQTQDWLLDAEGCLAALMESERRINVYIDDHTSEENYVSKPTVPCPFREGEHATSGGEYTKEILKQLQTAIVPCRPASGLSQWKQALADWQAIDVPDESLEVLEQRRDYLKLCEEYAELSQIEYNPECHVCCKNPGILQKKAVKKKISKLTKLGVCIGELDRESLEDAIATRRTYEDRVDFMKSEMAAWKSAETDIVREQHRQDKLAVIWWSMWTTWESEMQTLKEQRNDTTVKITAIMEFKQTYNKKRAEYIDAVANLETSKAYDKYITTLNIAWHAVQRDIAVTTAAIASLESRIDHLQQYISWSDEFVGLTEDEVLLDAMDAWTAVHDELERKVAIETWKQRWATLTVEYSAARDAVAIYDERDRLQETIDFYKRIIAYWKFEDMDDKVEDALVAAAAASSALSSATDIVARCDANAESEQVIADVQNMLSNKLSLLTEFQKRFVGDKQHDGFKMWVYKTKVLPLIEEQVNLFIGQVDSFTLSIRIRKGHFIYMLHDRGSNPTLDHASGYQKFLVGLAMRVALSRIGAVGQNIRHIFIDEGFVAFDSANMLKIKEIMEMMLRMGSYKSIMLITHLENIKEIATMQVDVHRAEGAKTSYIRMGLKRKAVPKSKRVTTINPLTNEATTTVVVKKRGRPSKAAIAAAAAALARL